MDRASSTRWTTLGFNPCFSGSLFPTRTRWACNPCWPGFNPCFSGSLFPTRSGQSGHPAHESFNPCFSGSLFPTTRGGHPEARPSVSILVLVEVSFRRHILLVGSRHRLVSILVLVEVSFRLQNASDDLCRWLVSILVLVEVSFRPNAGALVPMTIRSFNPCFSGSLFPTVATRVYSAPTAEFQSLF